jgi:hypothetical protein
MFTTLITSIEFFKKINKTDYNDLMNKVIIPIYPDEEERNYNAHIKARALAGCYHDKTLVWMWWKSQ